MNHWLFNESIFNGAHPLRTVGALEFREQRFSSWGQLKAEGLTTSKHSKLFARMVFQDQ